jgi:hypothetical protein
MGEQRGPLADQARASPQQVAGLAHAFGVDIGEREVAAAQEAGDLLGVDLVVLGLGAVSELHVQGVTQDEGDSLLGAQVGEPVPGVQALDADHDVVAKRGEGFEDALGAGDDVFVEDDGAVLVQDTEVERPGVQVDATIESVGTGVETHHGLLGKGGP